MQHASPTFPRAATVVRVFILKLKGCSRCQVVLSKTSVLHYESSAKHSMECYGMQPTFWRADASWGLCKWSVDLSVLQRCLGFWYNLILCFTSCTINVGVEIWFALLSLCSEGSGFKPPSEDIRRSIMKRESVTHLLSAAVGCDRPLGGSSQCRSVVVEVAGRIHLVLWRKKNIV